MTEGIIIKGIAGFYYVKAGDTLYECKARGKFRNDSVVPIIGDHVIIKVLGEKSDNNNYEKAFIEDIMPRKNSLVRPPVANIDQAIVVFSVTYPKLHLDLLDRFLIIIEKENIIPYIVLNKIDETDAGTYNYLLDRYSKIGYDIMAVSAKKEIAVSQLKSKLFGKTSVFAGPSGVGKSTLLNTIEKKFCLETGEVSQKIKRGKHTTRHVELLPLEEGGYVVDTPGFTSLHFDNIQKEDLKEYFPEFRKYEGMCKFNGCMHIHEPGCKVKEAHEAGIICDERYNSYITYFEQLKNTTGKW
jgi:ribosome biogenesis GTPase